MKYLQINDVNKDVILELFSKAVDEEGLIIEKKTGKKLICPYSKQNIHINDFSILPGSATFVNNKIYCFAEHIASHK